jgi:DNA-binding response OmpR family regulator
LVGPLVVVPSWAVSDRTAVVAWLDRSTDQLIAQVRGHRLSLDRREGSITVDGETVAPDRLTFLATEALLVNAPRILSTDQLARCVWGEVCAVAPVTVRVLIHRVRGALGPEVGAAVRTVRGVGYGWREDMLRSDGRRGSYRPHP